MTEQPAALRSLARRPLVQDAALAFSLLLVCVLANDPQSVVVAIADKPGSHAWDGEVMLWIWWAATALTMAAITFRRSLPVPMLVAATVTAAVHLVQVAPPMVVDTGVLILLFTVAAHRGRAVALASLGGLLLLVTGWSAYSALNDLPVPGLPNTVVRIGDRSGPSIGDDVTTIERGAASNAWNTASVAGLALVAAWAIGSSVYNRRALLGQLHARALDLERERDHRATLAVAAERGRISRELHDVVAHGLSMIVIQAQGGAAALDDRPTDTRTALEAIVKTGRDSLADMRRAVGALGEVDDSWQPQPGLAHLPALLSQVRQTGTPVRLQVEGTVAELPSAVDLSAYRLIQEALTNTMKHAGTGATAEVSVCFRPAELSLEVRDDGRAAPGDDSLGPDSLTGDDGLTDAGGNGLRGMRERVKLLGGRLEAGPAPEGGFVVRATLPIERRDA